MSQMTKPKITLTPEQADAFGAELDAIKERVMADLGQRDADYIRGVIKTQRALEVGGRALLMAGILPPAWLAGTAMLGISKILDNMEIGHNIMHGQYDWMRDPSIRGQEFEWDTACPADQWRHSHNYMHHTHTNIVGMDRDVGYGILRMSEDQKWKPYFLGNPVYAFLLMVLFQYGVALHEMESERIASGEIGLADKREVLQEIWRKTRKQLLKDYVAFPLLAGPFAPFVFTGNLTANLMRNVWSYMIIFCGHFPDGTQEFSVEETQGESRGQVVLPSGSGVGEPDRRQALPPAVRPPVAPDRAPPVPGHAGAPVPGDRVRGAGDLPALRDSVQRGFAAQAVRHRRAQDHQAGPADERPHRYQAEGSRTHRSLSGTAVPRTGTASQRFRSVACVDHWGGGATLKI